MTNIKLLFFLLILTGCSSFSKKKMKATHFKTQISYKYEEEKEAFPAEIFLSPNTLRIEVTNPFLGSLASLIENKEGFIIIDHKKKLYLKTKLNKFPLFNEIKLPPLLLSQILKEEELEDFSCEKKEEVQICVKEDLEITLIHTPLKEVLFKKEDKTLKIKIKSLQTSEVPYNFFSPSLKKLKEVKKSLTLDPL